jgi:hypothetical protein
VPDLRYRAFQLLVAEDIQHRVELSEQLE